MDDGHCFRHKKALERSPRDGVSLGLILQNFDNSETNGTLPIGTF
jgi:hypothetical protein